MCVCKHVCVSVFGRNSTSTPATTIMAERERETKAFVSFPPLCPQKEERSAPSFPSRLKDSLLPRVTYRYSIDHNPHPSKQKTEAVGLCFFPLDWKNIKY